MRWNTKKKKNMKKLFDREIDLKLFRPANKQSPLMSRGINGIIGDGSFPTVIRYARWFRLGSMSDSYSVNCFRDLDGNLSHVVDSRLTATSLSPIRMAKKALKLLYSLQLKPIRRVSTDAIISPSFICNIVCNTVSSFQGIISDFRETDFSRVYRITKRPLKSLTARLLLLLLLLFDTTLSGDYFSHKRMKNPRRPNGIAETKRNSTQIQRM